MKGPHTEKGTTSLAQDVSPLVRKSHGVDDVHIRDSTSQTESKDVVTRHVCDEGSQVQDVVFGTTSGHTEESKKRTDEGENKTSEGQLDPAEEMFEVQQPKNSGIQSHPVEKSRESIDFNEEGEIKRNEQ